MILKVGQGFRGFVIEHLSVRFHYIVVQRLCLVWLCVLGLGVVIPGLLYYEGFWLCPVQMALTSIVIAKQSEGCWTVEKDIPLDWDHGSRSQTGSHHSDPYGMYYKLIFLMHVVGLVKGLSSWLHQW